MRKLSFNKMVLVGLMGFCFAANVSAIPLSSNTNQLSLQGFSPFPNSCEVEGSYVQCDGDFGAGAYQAAASSALQRINPDLLDGFNCQVGTPITVPQYIHYMVSFMAEAFTAKYKDPTGLEYLNPMAEAFFCGRDKAKGLATGTSQAEHYSSQGLLDLSYVARGLLSVLVNNLPNCVMSSPFEWYQYAFNNGATVNNSTFNSGWGGPTVFAISKAIVDINDPSSCCADGSLSDLARDAVCPAQ